MRNHVRLTMLLLPLATAGCDSLHARLLAQDGVSLYRHGQVAEAAAKFEQAEKLDPYIPPIQLNLGFASLAIYQNSPKSPEGTAAATRAIVAFEKFLQLKPDEERARVYLIQTFVDTGRYDDAVAYFKPAVDKTPPDPEALGTLGIIASKTGRYEEAKSWYEKRIAAQPNNADAQLALGVLMWDYLHNHVTDVAGPDRVAMSDVAIGHLGESIRLAPKAPAAYTYTNLAYRERALGQPNDDGKRTDLEQASKFFKQAEALQKGAK
jgi:tetratricopeptide (TPR) repeat protein